MFISSYLTFLTLLAFYNNELLMFNILTSYTESHRPAH